MKNCSPFSDCINGINNTQIDIAKDLDVVVLMYNVIEYSNNYAKASGSLWQHQKDIPRDSITDSKSFKSKTRITGRRPADCNTKDVEIAVPLKYLSNFWRTLEMPLINFEINLILNCLKNCLITSSTGDQLQLPVHSNLKILILQNYAKKR